MAHVYTTQGTTIAAIFHGVCSICGVKYFHSYKEKTITLDEEEKKEWYFYSPANESKYFQISSKTFFQKSFTHMYNGGSVAHFCGGFSGTRRLAMLRRRAPENPPKNVPQNAPLYMCVRMKQVIFCDIELYCIEEMWR